MPQISLQDIRLEAARLQQKLGSIPTLKEVAQALAVNSDLCRSIINNARRGQAQPLGWEELGIQPGLFSRERQELRTQLQGISTDRARIYAVSKVLELVQSRELSPAQARILVYALLTGESYYQKLDLPFARYHRLDPHQVSAALHSSRRRPFHRPGAVERLEQAIITGAADNASATPGFLRCRQFLAGCITLFRSCAEPNLFTHFIEQGSSSTETIRLLGQHLTVLTEQHWPKELHITDRQAALIRNLVQTKQDAAFTTLKAFAARFDLDASGIQRAFQKREKYLSLPERLIQGAERIRGEKSETLSEALSALHKSKTIAPEHATSVLSTLSSIQEAQQVLTETQKSALQLMFATCARGERPSIETMAKQLGIAQETVFQSLYGRDGKAGAIGRMDALLQSIDPAVRKQMVESLVPLSLKHTDGLLKQLAATRPHTDTQRQRKEQLLNALESFIADLTPPLSLTVIAGASGSRHRRELMPYEISRLIHCCLGRFEGNLTRTRIEFADALGLRQDISISEKRLRVFMQGSHRPGSKSPGAISTLSRRLKSCQKTLTRYNQHPETEAYPTAEHHAPASYNEPDLMQLSRRIVQNVDPFAAIKQVSLFCATRPHTVREIMRTACQLALAAGDRASAGLFVLIYRKTEETAALLTDPTLSATMESLWSGPHIPRISLLIEACHSRKVSSEQASWLLSNLAERQTWLGGASIIEAWANYAYNTPPDAAVPVGRLLARTAYERFVERNFGGILSLQELRQHRTSYSMLMAVAEQHRAERAEHERHLEHLISGFFKQYSLHAVIRTFCSHLIQGPGNPFGTPYENLMEVAHEAVFNAARRYNPQAYAAAGKPIATFNTVAVNTIKWECLNQAKRFARDLERNPIRLEDSVGRNSDDGATYHDLIAQSDPQLDLESELKYEQVAKGLSRLKPAARRIIELRFELGQESPTGEDASLRVIAEILHRENLTPTKLSSERIRQILSQSLLALRTFAFNGSRMEWANYFSGVEEHTTPHPFALRPDQDHIDICPGISFDIKSSEINRSIVFEIDKVFSESRRHTEIIVQARDISNLEPLGTYVITFQRGKLLGCERVD